MYTEIKYIPSAYIRGSLVFARPRTLEGTKSNNKSLIPHSSRRHPLLPPQPIDQASSAGNLPAARAGSRRAAARHGGVARPGLPLARADSRLVPAGKSDGHHDLSTAAVSSRPC